MEYLLWSAIVTYSIVVHADPVLWVLAAYVLVRVT